MRKLWVLAWKEVKLAFRDVGAIVTMLVTPLVLTMIFGAAFGGGGTIADLPVLLLNRDEGVFAEELVSVFELEGVRELVALERVSDEAAARARVEADEVVALIVVPEDFSDHVLPLAAEVERRLGLDLFSLEPDAELTAAQQAEMARAFLEIQEAEIEPAVIEIYASPDWQLSASVVKSIVQQGLEMLHMRVEGMTIVISRLVVAQAQSGEPATDDARLLGVEEMTGEGGAMTGGDETAELPIELAVVSGSGRPFNWISYTATSLSVTFLMFAVTSGGRTLLAELAAGTLPRLLVAPLSPLTVLLGKMGGVVLTGTLQMVILYGATSLLGAYWGAPPAVLVVILFLVIFASSVGALVSAWARSAGQAAAIGTAVTLIGSALSGSFFPRSGLPQWVQTVSLVTPNAWGIELFGALQMGGHLGNILPHLGIILLITAAYYAVALIGFRRQFA